jgi:hypothetical protein
LQELADLGTLAATLKAFGVRERFSFNSSV